MAMVDLMALSAQHTSEDANRKSRRRHQAETRLKAYGMAAIGLAGLALAILIWTVASKASSVVYEYYLDLEIQAEVSESDLQRLQDPNPRIRVPLDGLVRDGAKALVGADLGRSERRELYRILSTDAGLELGDELKADTSLVGQTLAYPALLDDEVQMFLKGGLGRLVHTASSGTLEMAEEDDKIRVSFGEGAFQAARDAVAETREYEARRALAEARRQDNAVSATERALANAETDDERAAIEKNLESFINARDAAVARATALNEIAANPNVRHILTDQDPSVLIRANGGWLIVEELDTVEAVATVLRPLDSYDSVGEGDWTGEMMERPAVSRNLSDLQVSWIEDFQREGKIEQRFNWRIMQASDSSNAELAGIWGAMVGSFWTMIVTFMLAFPLGVMASIYLEEFAPKNRLTDFIEVNINNLAAVPSIVFGLFGITVLISGVQLFGVDLFNGLLKTIVDDPRSTPLAGGFVLALMSLPTIIIAARASIRAVPPSIRDAALGIGASKLQTSTHHVLPLAMPGIMTGSIIAMAQALGETAPLIIIGMNSFIQEAPGSPVDKGNVLPSLIYLWNNNSERLFDGKTAMAIVVLLIFLIAMNALAVVLRKRFERRW